MFCSNCGKKLNGTEVFCSNCGNKILEINRQMVDTNKVSSLQQTGVITSDISSKKVKNLLYQLFKK